MKRLTDVTIPPNKVLPFQFFFETPGNGIICERFHHFFRFHSITTLLG